MTVTAPRSVSPAAPAPSRRREAASIDVVVPVHNEEAALADSIRRLQDHLTASMPYVWRIVIADNASTDATGDIARAGRRPRGRRPLALPEKGRGRALRAAWLASDADVVCYMDVDLSTDLAALLPLVAPLVSGHSDVAIGTRLSRAARVVPGRGRRAARPGRLDAARRPVAPQLPRPGLMRRSGRAGARPPTDRVGCRRGAGKPGRRYSSSTPEVR